MHRSAEIRPDLGSYPGKGEAMWKSLFVTSGDVLVFMDADLLDWDTHFVPGLLGPLLTRPEVALVKGFYERPWLRRRAACAVRGRPGDRARGPAPDPAAVPRARRAAPAAGGGVGDPAVAVREPARADGYAVELASLVDTVRLYGLDALAQVDLGTRAHRHQSLSDLSASSADIVMAGDVVDAGAERFVADWVGGVDHGDAWVTKVYSAKWRSVEAAKRVVDIALDVAGGAGMFHGNELERLYRDVRCGGFHPGNDAITHEMVGKSVLGVINEQPRW